MYFVPEAARPKTQQSSDLLMGNTGVKGRSDQIRTLRRMFSQSVFISCHVNSSEDITSCSACDGSLSGVCLSV